MILYQAFALTLSPKTSKLISNQRSLGNMHKIHFIIFLFGANLFCHNPALPKEPDFEIENIIELKVSEHHNQFELSSTVKFEQVYLSDRSLDSNEHFIGETYYAKLSKLKAVFRDKKVDRDNIVTFDIPNRNSFLSDDKGHVIILPKAIDKGDKFAYSYRLKYIDITFLPAYEIPNLNYLKKFQIIIEHPKAIEVEFEIFFTRDDMNFNIERLDNKKTVLTFDSVAYREPIPYFDFNDYHAVILIHLKENGQAVNPVTIPDFLAWYGKHLDLGSSFENDTILSEIIGSSQTPESKLAAVYDFVRKNIRYISDSRGIGGIIPFQPDTVLVRKYGDCKDVAYLTSSLARAAGLEVFMSLVHSKIKPEMNGTWIGQFNHVVCCLKQDSSLMFFDPNSPYLGFGSMHDHYVGHQTLILDPRNPRLVEIPPSSNDPYINVVVCAHIDSLDQATALITLRGDLFYYVVRAYHEKPVSDQKDIIHSLIGRELTGISLNEFEIIDHDDYSINISARANLKDFIITTPVKKYIPQLPFSVVNGDILKRADDPYPLHIDHLQDINLEINLDAPGYRLEYDTLQLTGEPARYLAQASMLDNTRFNFVYRFTRKDKILYGSAKDNFLRFCREYLENKNGMFGLREGKS